MDRVEVLVRRHWWVLGLLVVTIGGSYARGAHESTPASGPAAAVLGAVAVLALLMRFERPEATVVVTAAAVTAYFALGQPDGPIYLSVFCALFALALRRPLRALLRYDGAALVAIGATLVIRLGTQHLAALEVTARVLWFVAVGAAAAALGMAQRNRREAQSAQTRRVASEEKLRMAQDLHDGVGHGLAVIAMQAGVALHVLDRDPEKARASLEAIRDTSRESLAALRVELDRLAAERDPAPLAPRPGLADLAVLVDRVRAGGLEVRLDVTGDPVTGAAGEVAYAVVQESLTNVLKHAGARHCSVRVERREGLLTVTVTDDGTGTGEPGTGFGIPGMRSRATAIGGRLEAGPGPGGGFVVRAELPAGEETG